MAYVKPDLSAVALMMAAAPLSLFAIGLLQADAAQADPLTPAEVQFLNDVHSNVPNTGETDAQLLSDGWYSCHNRAIGVSPTAMGVLPAVAQWALIDLCPNGCAQGCGHH